jgi:predicted MFS family arabinose efflux permease
MTTRQADISGRSATLTVAAAGAGLAMAVYITPITTLAGTATALHAGPDGQAWILSAMALGLVLGLLPSGAVGDVRGRRRMFRAGAGGLAVASALGAVAPDTAWLVAARMGQGLAAGAVLSCSLGMVGHAFAAGPQRARASGLWGAGLGSGMLVGPLLAGGLDAWIGWRGAYWLAAGLAAVLALVARRVPESWSAQRRPADVPGMLLLGAALAALLVALVEARTGWARPSVLVLLAAGIGSGTAFVAVELRRQAPMLDPRLLRRPDFAAATVGALVTGGGVIALLSFLPTLVQRGLGHSALVAALVLLPWSVPTVAGAALARLLPGAAHPRAHLVGGLLVVAVAQALLAGVGPQTGLADLVPGLILAGAANGVLNAALARQAVASAPDGRSGFGSGVNNTARYVGSALGVTVVVVLAGHADPATLITGWNLAALVTAGFSVLGAVAVAACRPGSRT